MGQPSFFRKKYWLYKDIISSAYFDCIYNIETKKLDQALISADVSPYEPTDWFSLHYILKELPIKPASVFVDIGTGKGRPLFMAAQYPFSKIVGIEKAEALAVTARKNVDNFLKKQTPACSNIEVWNADATQVEFPPGVQVISTFNPFRGEIFSGFLKNLERYLRSASAPVFFVYQNPLCHDQIVALPYAKELKVVPAKYAETFKVYEFEPILSSV